MLTTRRNCLIEWAYTSGKPYLTRSTMSSLTSL